MISGLVLNDKPIEEWKNYTDLTCEDAISKKEVFSILTRLMSEAGKDGKLILSDAKEMIGDLPSVAPVRLVGEWILDDGLRRIHKCSNCGQLIMTDDIDVYNYCHGCGADMRGGAV